MSKTMIMLLNERVGKIKEVELGKKQISMLEKELENSYEKEDYENLSEFRGIKIGVVEPNSVFMKCFHSALKAVGILP